MVPKTVTYPTNRFASHVPGGIGLLWVFLVVAAFSVDSLAQAASGAPAYRIAKGDKVSIAVYNEPELSLEKVPVGPDGTIAFPLIGDVKVAGLTALDVEAEVTRRLKDGYLKAPSVSVGVDAYRLYFIKGEVKRPGGYNFVEGLTVAKAIAMARGFTERASEEKISIIRETQPNRSVSVSPSAPVLPGDVITIGESFF